MSELSKEKWAFPKYQGVEYGNILVSNLGAVAKLEGNQVMSIERIKKRRRSVSLRKGRSSISVALARVMLATFEGVIFKKNLVADHINNIPWDNRICNLQAISQSKNVSKDHWTTKRGNKNGSPRGVIPTETGFFRANFTLKGNNLYNSISIHLGMYGTVEGAKKAIEIAKSITKLYKVKNNDKIAIVIKKEISSYRTSKNLKQVRRYGQESSKIECNKWNGTKSYSSYVKPNYNYFEETLQKTWKAQ